MGLGWIQKTKFKVKLACTSQKKRWVVQVGAKVVHRQTTSNKISQNWSPCFGLERSHHFHFYHILCDWHWKLGWNEIKFWDFRTIASNFFDYQIMSFATFCVHNSSKKLQLKSLQGCSFWIDFSNVTCSNQMPFNSCFLSFSGLKKNY